ncbi:MAG: hypothetical protein QNJ97_07290 [Myxococcota bacterium]|nr:hypothetical protein [Myxococcota bacterium]
MKCIPSVFLSIIGTVSIIVSCSHFLPPQESEQVNASAAAFEKIEDAEDGDDQILNSGGRNGYIYTYVDEHGSTIEPTSSNFAPAKGGAGGSESALRFKGSTANSAEVYAGIGFSFREPIGSYDASRCKGISFLAKKAPESTAALRFKMPDMNTTPEAGICQECYNDFGISFTLTDEWIRYVVYFADMKQEEGWGNPNPPHIDQKNLFGMQWQTTTSAAKFDIWIDDIFFVECDPN